jgi:hypothetical protein
MYTARKAKDHTPISRQYSSRSASACDSRMSWRTLGTRAQSSGSATGTPLGVAATSWLSLTSVTRLSACGTYEDYGIGNRRDEPRIKQEEKVIQKRLKRRK